MNPLDQLTPPLGAGAVRPNSPQNAGPDKMKAAAQDFESIFIFQILDAMYAGLPTDGLFGGGPGEKIFRSMMNEEIAKSISARGGFGIGEAVHRELLHIQEMQNGNGSI